MSYTAINLDQLMAQISDYWSPKIIGQMNDYHFKLARALGEFVWHSHANTDEVFIILDGELIIEMRDGQITLKKGEMFIVPKGIEHRPIASSECHLLLVEPVGTVNTGSAGGRLKVDPDWI
jgi:mannose-6-phosphate isomerase-like protein (cupin superfamily)